jgi:hypothetical protein
LWTSSCLFQICFLCLMSDFHQLLQVGPSRDG